MTWLFGLWSVIRGSRAMQWLIAAGAVVLALLGARHAGRRAERKNQKIRDLEFGADIARRDDDRKKKAVRDADVMSHDQLVAELRKSGRLRD